MNRKLRAARIRAALSQPELADRIDVSQSLVSAWERGDKTPTAEAYDKLVEVLGSDDLGYVIAQKRTVLRMFE